jgi:AbiJ N-terminal domain 4
MLKESFSRRNRYSGGPKEITVREDAPEGLRIAVFETVHKLGWKPSVLRNAICAVLRVRPDPDNWSEYPNIWGEVKDLMYGCDWFKVYDIIEALYHELAEYDRQDALRFADEINAVFVEDGIGWQLLDGKVITRGPEAFEATVREASKVLNDTGRSTAAGHMQEALQDLSRRPDADLSGAIYHATGAMECAARDVSGDAKATFGEVIRKHPELLPTPLNTAAEKIWGYASNVARHVQEGRNPNREEAVLVVGLAAAVTGYLGRKR